MSSNQLDASANPQYHGPSNDPIALLNGCGGRGYSKIMETFLELRLLRLHQSRTCISHRGRWLLEVIAFLRVV